MLFLFGVFGGAAAQPWMAAVSAREGANGGGSVRDDGLSTVSRDGVVTEQCLVRRGGAGGNRGIGPIIWLIGTDSKPFERLRSKGWSRDRASMP